MVDAGAGLRAEMASLVVARHHFPMWTNWGVADESEAVHSLGLSHLVATGQKLGFAACSDFPVDGARIRADAVWWDTSTRAPAAIFEFERLKDGTELRTKIRNLMRAWHAARSHPLLGLVFWSKNFFVTGGDCVRDLWSELSRGFEDDRRVRVPAVPVDYLLVFECHHLALPDGRITLKGFTERGRT